MFKQIGNFFKGLLGDNNEIIESFDMAVVERIRTPFYGYFFVSWMIINWKLIYIAFFINQDILFQKNKFLRIEYLNTFLLPKTHWYNFIVLPLILTILFFFLFPFITRIFHRQYLKNQNRLKLIEIQESVEKRKSQKELIKQEVAVIQSEATKAREIKKATKENPEFLWEQEYDGFKNNPSVYIKLPQLVDSIYKHGGSTEQYGQKIIDTDILAMAHTRNWIEMDNHGNIKLTEKGKYIVSRYLEKNRIRY